MWTNLQDKNMTDTLEQTSFVILRWIFFILLDSWHGELCVKNEIISWNFDISTESNHRTLLPPDASRQVLAVAVSRWLAHREPSVVLQLFLPAVPHVTWTGVRARGNFRVVNVAAKTPTGSFNSKTGVIVFSPGPIKRKVLGCPWKFETRKLVYPTYLRDLQPTFMGVK